MLEEVNIKDLNANGMRFGIVASKFNGEYVNSMMNAAVAVLQKADANCMEVIRVPGAYEIPVVVGHLIRTKANLFDAVICLGVILRGETTHAKHIAEAVSLSLANAQLTSDIPIINGVYLFENREQAEKRCVDPAHNRGIELANTAIEMACLIKRIRAWE
ncbi:MAG: 6,7-dimethyl-8-ribityllumazine synthase [Verrucomicrobiae bacterium]|nr:6,7-dimethyl-8-ribityllumazine synthase [Verrucomicrobiae bacterium]